MTRRDLAKRLSTGRTFWMAGAYDALSARLIEKAGFDGVFTTGFGLSASSLGLPDMELLTLTENAELVRRIVNSIDVPVFADADTGYGNTLNVIRTVKEFERAGVAGLVLEDQVSPKRCPAAAKTVAIVPVQESIGKLKAALDTRVDQNMKIIARTDAVDPSEALDRAAIYAEVGADLIQPISRTFTSHEQLHRLKSVSTKPLSLQLIEETWMEKLTRDQVESVALLATYPLLPLMTVSRALAKNLSDLMHNGFAACPDERADLATVKQLLKFDAFQQLQQVYENSGGANKNSIN